MDHYALFYKLAKTGMRGKLFKTVYSMYGNVSACVKTPHGLTEFFHCNSGLQQGSVISPLLFCFFINDIGKHLVTHAYSGVYVGILQLYYLLYADDLCLFSSTVIGLQRLFNRLSDFCATWKLSVNISKTKIIVFRRGGVLKSNEQWVFEGTRVDVVPYYNYLGIIFSSFGAWFQAQQTIANQASKCIFSLKKHFINYKYMPIDVLLTIFDTKILPILLYGCEVWGFHGAKDIESVHIKFCRYALKLSNCTSTAAIRGELGRFTMKTQMLIRIIKYWLHILNMDQHRYVFQCYKFQYGKSEQNQTCWATSVKQLLFSYGFGQAWLSQGVGNEEIFVNLFKTRARDIDIQTWSAELNDSPKLETYISFKTSFNMESYLYNLEEPILLSILCKFRISAHKLNIETGRRQNIHREQRKCKVCPHLVENEFHFLICCPLYAELRAKYLPAYYYTHPNRSKFVELMKTENKYIQKNIASYLKQAFIKRENI